MEALRIRNRLEFIDLADRLAQIEAHPATRVPTARKAIPEVGRCLRPALRDPDSPEAAGTLTRLGHKKLRRQSALSDTAVSG